MDHLDLQDAFERLRDDVSRHTVPPAAGRVIRRERRRQAARWVTAGAAVAVVVGGAGTWASLRPAGDVVAGVATSTGPAPTAARSSEGGQAISPPFPAPTAVSPSATVSPTSPSSAPSASASLPVRRPPAAPVPSLDVELAVQPGSTASSVRLTARVHGQVPELYDGLTGKPLGAANVEPTGTRIDWGDGSMPGGSDGGDVVCRAAAPLVPLDETFGQGLEHTYPRPGTYTVTFTATACPPVGGVSRTAQITVG
ncbi:MAG: hypothetical protein ACTHQ3_08735 [Motilibacteraceae bacterium]